MPGVPPSSGAEADFEPTPDQIEAWASDSAEAPQAAEKPEENTEEVLEESPEPQAEPEEVQEEEAKPKESDKKKSKYSERVEKRKNAEKWFNEQHKQLRLREKALKDQAEAIAKREQELEKKPEDWLAFAQQLEQYGDYEKAEQARQMAEQAKHAQAQRQTQAQTQQEFESQWYANEQDIASQDPDFFQEGSYVRENLTALFNDPEIGQLYRSHPFGIWAAYHRVRLQQAQQIIPPLVKYCEQLKAELDKLQKGNAPLSSAPKSNLGPKHMQDMSEEELEASIRKELSKL